VQVYPRDRTHATWNCRKLRDVVVFAKWVMPRVRARGIAVLEGSPGIAASECREWAPVFGRSGFA
jgi:hypothetical protein